MSIDETRPFQPINIAILTVSDTRGASDDKSGDLLAARAQGDGHHLADRALVTDDFAAITRRELFGCSDSISMALMVKSKTCPIMEC